MKSIIQSEKKCYFTERTDDLEDHHIYFNGTGQRKLSEKYGLKVWLTHDYHNEPPEGVHHNKARRRELERIGQMAFMARFPELDFIKIFGRNYI